MSSLVGKCEIELTVNPSFIVRHIRNRIDFYEREMERTWQLEFYRNRIAELRELEAFVEKIQEVKKPWKEYAIALQRLYDNGGPLIEPALAREVDELRERCDDR